MLIIGFCTLHTTACDKDPEKGMHQRGDIKIWQKLGFSSISSKDYSQDRLLRGCVFCILHKWVHQMQPQEETEESLGKNKVY